MSWLRIDSGFHDNPAIDEVGNEAAGAYVRCSSYCADNQTDGFISRRRALVIAKQRVYDKLVDAGLMVIVTPEQVLSVTERKDSGRRPLEDVHVKAPEHGWFIPKYLHYNYSKRELRERQKKRSTASTSESATERTDAVSFTRARTEPTRSSVEQSSTAQTLVAEYVDATRELGVDPPRRVVGQVAQQIGQLLDEGQEVGTVSAALRLMIDKRLHPSTLPSLILEAKAGPARRQDERKPRHEPPVEEALHLPQLSEEERLANLERLKAMTA